MATTTVPAKENGGKGLNPQTLGNGQEQYEHFPAPVRTKTGPKMYCQYDYRHTNGRLFSCVAPTLEDAWAKRDAWLVRSNVPEAANEGGDA